MTRWLLLFLAIPLAARTYTTSFPGTENPISESGNWANGKTDGVDWSDAATVPGHAYGILQSPSFADTVAIVKGTWGGNQTVTITTFINSIPSQDEIAVRLNTSISANSITGYEIGFKNCATPCTDAGAYMGVTRWNGPYGNFTQVGMLQTGTQYGIQNGDTVVATNVNGTITVKKNGTTLLTVTDTTYSGGSPGIGMDGPAGNYNGIFGITSFTGTDGLPTVTSTAASSITTTTASAGGNVTDDGGVSVTSRGTCYSTSANPTSPCTSDGSGTGSFTSSLTGLSSSTLYHIRAFATNTTGTTYGNDLTFTTSNNPPTGTVISGAVTLSGGVSIH